MTDLQNATAAGAVAGGIAATTVIFVVALYVLFIIAWWKIFTKAGVAGWKSLIPIYNTYTLFRISGMSGFLCFLSPVAIILLNIGGVNVYSTNVQITTMNPWIVAGLIAAFITGIVSIVQTVKLSGAFGKGTGFKVASVFFPNITSLILAFGKAKYDKKVMHD